MSFFIGEKGAGTLRIPVKIVKEKITYQHGGSISRLREGCTGVLILAEDAVLDPAWSSPLQQERVENLLPAQQLMFLAMRGERIPVDREQEIHHLGEDEVSAPNEAIHSAFVQVRIIEPLNILLRGTKPATLRPCRCILPDMDEAEAKSLNHAYTLASQRYEPERLSHTGNVFEQGFYYDKGTKKWHRLERLRARYQHAVDEHLLLEGQKGKTRRRKADTSQSAKAEPSSDGKNGLLLDI